MSFIIIRTYGDEWKKEVLDPRKSGVKKMIFESDAEINREFMNLIATECRRKIKFLKASEVMEYLKQCEIYEVSPFVYELTGWREYSDLSKDKTSGVKAFVYDFPVLLKLGCIAVKYPYERIILVNQENQESTNVHKIDFYSGGLSYLGPIIEKRDIYMYIKSYYQSGYFGAFESKYCKAELILRDARRNIEISGENLEDYLDKLDDETGWVTREIDAQFFKPDKVIVYPYRQILYDYLQVRGYGAGVYLSEEICKSFMVDVKGKCNYDGAYKRMPINLLLYINGKWKYAATTCCSIVEPCFDALLYDILEAPERYGDKENKISKVFAMVLNCDKTCAADQYWDYICFFAKYETGSKLLEICDQGKALLEFHELLQQSTDMVRSEWTF